MHYRITWYQGGVQTWETDNQAKAFDMLAKLFFLNKQNTQTIVMSIDMEDE